MPQTGNGAFTYQEAGEQAGTSGPVLVFLHGIGGGAAAFRPQLDHFGGRGLRAVAWDAPGFGGSAPLAVATVATLAAALDEFLDQIGVVTPVLVGHSLGGMVVLEHLARELEWGSRRARAAVLAQTSPAFGPADGEWQREWVRARLAPLEAGRDMAAIAADAVPGMAGRDADRAGLALMQACMARTPADTYRAMVHAVAGFDRRDALAGIGVPVLVLAGTEDRNAPAPMMERMASRIPGARFVALDGVGHLANLEQPGRFNAALETFLAALDEQREHAAP